jgi:PIN domain nuclease of toxin-antitoxin system
LLDTHALLWLVSGDQRLRRSVVDAMQADGTRNFISMASFWEIGIKTGLGKLDLGDDPLPRLMARADEDGLQRVGIEPAHCHAISRLPLHHRDPFDRMLAAQALVEKLTIVSADPSFDAYGVTRLW